jgi:uncharacterized protein (DUF58 family)
VLTRSGLGAAIGAVVLIGCGLWWHYEELVVAGAVAGAAVVLALWTARARQHSMIVRHITSPRVARGDPIRLVYRATNPGRRHTPPVDVVDVCDGIQIRVRIDDIGPGAQTTSRAVIPTRRRGMFDVGPWVVERVDPFGLAIGQRTSETTGSIIVHPRIHRLHGPYGAMHTVEDEAVIRRAASDPLSGFVSLREYVDGDDPRLIHWPTSARLGTLMLREHVELRRPEFTVVLDAAQTAATAEDFEEMVDVAASIAVHALSSGVAVMLRTTSRQFPGTTHPVDRDTRVLDLLTPITQTDPIGSLTMAEIFRGGIDHSLIAFVTGPSGPSTTFAHTEKLSVIRIGREAVAAPGVTIAAKDAAEFVQRWRPWH